MTTTSAPRSVRTLDSRIAAASIPGFPLTTRRALREAGVGPKSISRRITAGAMWEIWPTVLVCGVRPRDVSPDLVCAAAVLLAGPDAALDGASALERRGLWDRHDGSIHVSCIRNVAPVSYRIPRSWRSFPQWKGRRSTLTVRFTRLVPDAARVAERVAGVPARKALDALVRAASYLSPHQLAHIIREAERSGQVTLDALEREVARRRGSRGIRALRRAIELRRAGSAGTKSRSEDAALPHVTRAFGEPRVNVRGIAGIPGYEPDFCWPEWRWILEVEGDHHTDDPAQRLADEANDRALRAAGWIVVRIPWRRVWTDIPGVIAEARAAFGVR